MPEVHELGYLEIGQAAAALASGELSSLDLTDAVLARIERLNPTLNGYTCVMSDSAQTDARAADARSQAGERRGPMDGIPIAIKDVIDTAGVVTTYGSIRFRDHRPAADAHVVQQLRNAGAVILGKTNTHELARGITTDNPHFGPTRNPWDLTRHPGGSSGGSAAAVATGMALGALGTDTGGSVRIPSHMTGITGLKPTHGLVGRTGARPLVRNFDHIGPMTRSAADCALMLDAMTGPDPNDPDSVTHPAGRFTTALDDPVGGYRAGIIQAFADEALPRIRELFADAVQAIQDLDVQIDSWTLPASLDPKAAQVVSRSEGYVSIHEMFDGDFSSIDPSIHERLNVGADATAFDYLRGLEARTAIEAAVSDALESRDFLLSPAYPYPAEPIKRFDARANDTLHASFFNASHHPALVVPMGFADGLPVGLQIVGRLHDDATVLQIGHAFQQVTNHHRERPESTV
ncbi:MAG: amidase [Chloroflexota bacterium]|nr:amidase [Chloroflexota bacterium]MDE2920382.1 amidase [Chloroflexota bacterium]